MKVFPSLKARQVYRENAVLGMCFSTLILAGRMAAAKAGSARGTNSGFSIPEQAREVYRSGKNAGR